MVCRTTTQINCEGLIMQLTNNNENDKKVRNNKSLITEKTFNSRDELLQFLKESKEFNELNKDHPFWHDPKYLLTPFFHFFYLLSYSNQH